MLHKERHWCVAPVETAGELAEKLSDHTWTLCTGFRLGEYVYLNDSVSEDSAVEFGVVKEVEPGRWIQIETVTFGWLNEERSLETIQHIQKGESDGVWAAKIAPPVLQSPEEHGSCELCR